MRKVIIREEPPESWNIKAKAAIEKLRAATNDAERTQVIKANEKLWRKSEIRDWLLKQFNNKCWYTEAYDSVSSIHVDHYRPKGRVKDLAGNKFEGYWWLAFDWKNYRICGELLNVKKGDIFILSNGVKANSEGTIPLDLESPVLIDPTTDQTRLVTYEREDNACLAVPVADATEAEKDQVEKTIDILGLNRLNKLNQKRAERWDSCLMEIAEYKGARESSSQPLKVLYQALAAHRLKEMVKYNAEFSSISEACIRKNAPIPLIASVFEHQPPT